MLSDIIYNFLAKRLDKKKHDIIKLRWQKAELEKKLRELKNNT